MKNQKVIAKITVKKCDERLNHQSGRQDFNKDGNPLWTILCIERSYHDDLEDYEQIATKFKSLIPLDKGDHIVQAKVVSMGEGSGNFIRVKNYYTIEKIIDVKKTIFSLFETDASFMNKPKTTIKTSSLAQ